MYRASSSKKGVVEQSTLMEESQLKDVAPDPGSQNAQANPASAVERLLISFGEQRFQEYARYRFAEEREWYESALFYQRRQRSMAPLE